MVLKSTFSSRQHSALALLIQINFTPTSTSYFRGFKHTQKVEKNERNCSTKSSLCLNDIRTKPSNTIPYNKIGEIKSQYTQNRLKHECLKINLRKVDKINLLCTYGCFGNIFSISKTGFLCQAFPLCFSVKNPKYLVYHCLSMIKNLIE